MKITTEQKKTLEELIASNELRNTLNLLLEIANEFPTSAYRTSIINIQGDLSGLEKEKNDGLLSDEAFAIRESRIRIRTSKIVNEIWLESTKNKNPKLLEFEELKNDILPIYLEHNGIKATIDLLENLLNDSDIKKALGDIQLELSKAYAIYSFTVAKSENSSTKKNFSEWQSIRDSLSQKIDNIIYNLAEAQLVENWDNIFVENRFGLKKKTERSSGHIYGLFTPADQIIIPENLEENRQKNAFRRLLHKSQDAIAVEDYASAYQSCLEIRNDLEPESAQLYEYLLLVFSKKTQTKNIVIEFFNGKTDSLKYLILYAGRYFQFQEDEKCSSPTGKYNVAEIINSLSESLDLMYSYQTGDYILSDPSKKDTENRRNIIKTIEIALEIFYSIPSAPPVSFLEIALNELCGGGKFDWLEVKGDKKGGWDLKNRELNVKIDALTKIKEINSILK